MSLYSAYVIFTKQCYESRLTLTRLQTDMHQYDYKYLGTIQLRRFSWKPFHSILYLHKILYSETVFKMYRKTGFCVVLIVFYMGNIYYRCLTFLVNFMLDLLYTGCSFSNPVFNCHFVVKYMQKTCRWDGNQV